MIAIASWNHSALRAAALESAAAAPEHLAFEAVGLDVDHSRVRRWNSTLEEPKQLCKPFQFTRQTIVLERASRLSFSCDL